ncbi:MAG: hypothetical protein AB1540_13130 [Bdellovibrionota bacterium]
MPYLSIRNVTFFLLLLFGLNLLTHAARAESALRTLAEANQAQYEEIKQLGVNATSEQIAQINQKHFGPARRALDAEHAGHLRNWKSAIKAAYGGVKKSLNKLLGNKSNDAKSREPAATTPDGARKIQDRNINATTGPMLGPEGARSIQYQKPKEEQPQVIDGIIQER